MLYNVSPFLTVYVLTRYKICPLLILSDFKWFHFFMFATLILLRFEILYSVSPSTTLCESPVIESLGVLGFFNFSTCPTESVLLVNLFHFLILSIETPLLLEMLYSVSPFDTLYLLPVIAPSLPPPDRDL